uniref:U-limacoditoxin(13)-As11 n=1 Tax=Acharia stimulea TaxID=691692 RepID=RF11_ACHST|nr:RecName: Full=U-limacoditoxin(13)-As11; Short=U-LCTX(13)-As11; Flags: Precursor [Acharia stimulea]WDQ26747.1 venom peptide [Acharia stimulea]
MFKLLLVLALTMLAQSALAGGGSKSTDTVIRFG